MAAMGFPCRLESGLGRFRRLSELEEIKQSVHLILTTRRGERPFRPRFGVNLDQYAFELMDATTCNLIRQEVIAALQMWEPRIWNIRTEFDSRPQEGQLVVNVFYEVRRTGISVSQPVKLPVILPAA